MEHLENALCMFPYCGCVTLKYKNSSSFQIIE